MMDANQLMGGSRAGVAVPPSMPTRRPKKRKGKHKGKKSRRGRK